MRSYIKTHGQKAFVQLTKKSALAGLFISIGAMFSMSVAKCGNLAQGVCFSVGLFCVLCCEANLFTGYIPSIQSVWNGKVTYKTLFIRLTLIWTFNLVGAFILALMALQIHMDASVVATAKASMPCHELFIKSILCNVMVCFAAWSYKTNRHKDTHIVDAAVSCVLPVACFVACGFEHSIADMFYMLLGLTQGVVSALDCAYVTGVATIGNFVGGVVFSWLTHEGSAL